MTGYFDKRSLLTFTSFILGFTLIYNLIQLSTRINGSLVLYPYMTTMLIASLLGCIGFFIVNPKLLGLSTVMWLISIAFNLAAVVFIIPIAILNILGRNKVITKMEIEEKDERDNNTSKDRD